MKEVSCRVFIWQCQGARAVGVPDEVIFQGMEDQKEVLLNPKNRMSWDQYAGFLERIQHYLQNDEKLAEIGRHIEQRRGMGKFIQAAALMPSLKLYFKGLMTWGLRANFSMVTGQYEDLGPRTIRLTVKIDPAYRDTPQNGVISTGAFEVTPRMFGLPEAVVEADIGDHWQQFTIGLPPSNSLWMRLKRMAAAWKGSDAVYDLMREQSEELHSSHATLSAVQRGVQQLEREILDAGAQARRRLAHDLHDGLGQHLTGLGIQTQLIRKQLQETDPEQSRQMCELERRILETSNYARGLARGLDRLVEADDSLVEALELVVSESHRLVGVNFERDLERNVEAPHREITLHLCHILEEAINNAVRHGAASSIRVRLRRDGKWGELSIEDNGSGEAGHLKSGEGLGLRAMHYRARQIGGHIRFQDIDWGGVAVLVRFPCKT